MSQQLFRDSALGQPLRSPTYVLSNLQKLNNVQGGIA